MLQVMLDDDVMRQLGVEANDNVQLDFDAKGTLHLMERGTDGELVKDSPLTGNTVYSGYSQEEQELLDEIRRASGSSKRLRRIIYSVIAATLFMLVMSFVLMFYLRR